MNSRKKWPVFLTSLVILLLGLLFFTQKDSFASDQNLSSKRTDFYATYSEEDRAIAAAYYPSSYAGCYYPVLPQMSSWPYGNHASMVTACQLSEMELKNSDTTRLLQSVLAYPLWTDLYAYNSIEQGIQLIGNSFNGFSELVSRSDFEACYKKLPQELQTAFPVAYSALDTYLNNRK